MNKLIITMSVAMTIVLAFTFTSCQKEEFPAAPGNAECADTEAPVTSTRSDEDPVPMRGTLKGSSGQVISGADVTLTVAGQSSPAQYTVTDSAGTYYFGNVDQGNYELKFSATGYISKLVSLGVYTSITRTDTLLSE